MISKHTTMIKYIFSSTPNDGNTVAEKRGFSFPSVF